MDEICNDCWLTYYPAYIGKKKVEKFVAERRKKPNTHAPNTKRFFALVAEDHGIRGYAICGVKRGEGHLRAIYVDPESTGKGYGSALVKRALKEFRKRGAKLVRLETMVQNKGSQRFYKRHGFRKARVINYFVRGHSTKCWRLEKEL